MKLSISRAWDEASTFIRAEAGPLFLIAFGLMALPGIIMQALMPRLAAGFVTTPGTPPDPSQMLAAMPAFFLMLVPVLLLSMWGNLTINVLALRREAVIGRAFGLAARRLLPLLGATLLLMLAAIVIFLPLAGGFVAAARGGRLGLVALGVLVVWLLFIFVGVRLMLMTAVAAAEPVGPIGMIRRSWRLTAGHFWKLLGFLLLMIVLFVVIAIVVGAVGGLLIMALAGPPTPGSLGSVLVMLISGLVQSALLVPLAVLLARIYAQLAGDDPASVGQVFD
jgi:hypothetical protein